MEQIPFRLHPLIYGFIDFFCHRDLMICLFKLYFAGVKTPVKANYRVVYYGFELIVVDIIDLEAISAPLKSPNLNFLSDFYSLAVVTYCKGIKADYKEIAMVVIFDFHFSDSVSYVNNRIYPKEMSKMRGLLIRSWRSFDRCSKWRNRLLRKCYAGRFGQS